MLRKGARTAHSTEAQGCLVGKCMAAKPQAIMVAQCQPSSAIVVVGLGLQE